MGATHSLFDLAVPFLALTACASASGGVDDGNPAPSEDLGTSSAALSGDRKSVV